MDLTPVKIRGKRKRKEPIAKAAASPQVSALSSQPSKNPQISKASKRPKLQKEKAAKTMPTLVGLPQELLEMIFLYSMNISLPRASTELGRRLSSKAVTMEFTMRSFFQTVDHKANIRDRKITSNPIIQSKLLACRFFTWEFFMDYVNKAHTAMIKLRGKIWEDAGVEVKGPKDFKGLWPFMFTGVTYLSFAEGFHIPEKLLHGPWTDDKAKLLYVLVSFSGEIDWESSTAGETAKEGLRQAIEQKMEYAVAALSVLLGIAQSIDTNTIRYAVIECGCNFKIVRHILFNAQILQDTIPKETLNFHDPKLWQWAEVNEGKGVLLKDLLRKADKFSLEFFLEGEKWTGIVSFPYGGPRFDPRTAFDGMSREFLIRLYQNHGRRITARRQRRTASVERPHNTEGFER